MIYEMVYGELAAIATISYIAGMIAGIFLARKYYRTQEPK